VTRYGPLAAATALLLGAAVETSANGDPTTLSAALLVAGFMILGAWLAIESYHLWKDSERGKADEGE